MVEIVYYVASSLDGFIADEDGGVGWLDPFMKTGEDYGFDEFMATVKAVLVGSRTYEQMLGFGAGGESETPCYVFTTRTLPSAGPHVRFTAEAPGDVVARLREDGIPRAWLMGGGKLMESFRREGLITHYAIALMPVLLGGGVSLFPGGGPSAKLNLLRSKIHPSGVAQLDYEVVPAS